MLLSVEQLTQGVCICDCNVVAYLFNGAYFTITLWLGYTKQGIALILYIFIKHAC